MDEEKESEFNLNLTTNNTPPPLPSHSSLVVITSLVGRAARREEVDKGNLDFLNREKSGNLDTKSHKVGSIVVEAFVRVG